MDKHKANKILNEIHGTMYDRHVLPHMAFFPHWFERYCDLAELVCEYFEVPYNKPCLTTQKDLDAMKATPESLATLKAKMEKT